MTEQEWLECTDPTTMLGFLRGKVSDRKLRLFAVASCRWALPSIGKEANRKIIEAVEQHMDVIAGEVGMGIAARRLIENGNLINEYTFQDLALEDAFQAAYCIAFQVPRMCRHLLGYEAVGQIMREVFGNPFRPPSFDSTWQTGQTAGLARAADDNRVLPSGHLDRDHLAVLSDALEEAGCDNATILDHLRGPGPHVRGCWVIDQLLGKD